MTFQTPNLVSFIGAPAVGKTALAQGLAGQEGIFFFNRDVMLDHIFGNDRESEQYRALTGPLTKSTWELAIYNTALLRTSIILESPMTAVTQGKPGSFIDTALEAAGAYRFRVSLIYCVAPADIVLARMKERGSPRDEPKYGNWAAFVRDFIDVPGPTYEHLKIDTTNAEEGNLTRISTYLRRHVP